MFLKKKKIMLSDKISSYVIGFIDEITSSCLDYLCTL